MAEQSCSKCGYTKSTDDFYKKRRQCKSCVIAQTSAYSKRPDIAPSRAANGRLYRRKPAVMASARLRSSQAYRTTKGKRRHIRAQLKHKYGITPEARDTLLVLQDFACAACARAFGDGVILNIDHCHQTGRIRGLLCRECNVALGLVDDSIDRLTGLVQYLQRPPIALPPTLSLVLVESPFAGGLGVELNLKYLRDALRDCFLKGEAPFASHALYTQPGVLDDMIPAERSLGIKAGLEWGSNASKTVIYTDLGISEGMRHGIENAKSANRPIEYRSLPAWAPKMES